MKVREVMRAPVVSVREDTPYREIVEVLMSHGISGAPVVDDAGHVVGMVSEADLVSREAYEGRPRSNLVAFLASPVAHRAQLATKADAKTARELMTHPCETVGPDEEVRRVSRRMLEHRIRRLPVVEAGRLVGIVSRHDILRVLSRPDDDIREEVEQLLGVAPIPLFDLQVAVEDGVATLQGRVAYAFHANEAEAQALKVDGVLGVTNRLRATWPPILPQTAPWY